MSFPPKNAQPDRAFTGRNLRFSPTRDQPQDLSFRRRTHRFIVRSKGRNLRFAPTRDHSEPRSPTEINPIICRFDRRTHRPIVRSKWRTLQFAPTSDQPQESVISTEERTASSCVRSGETCGLLRPATTPSRDHRGRPTATNPRNVSFRPKNAPLHRAFEVEKPAACSDPRPLQAVITEGGPRRPTPGMCHFDRRTHRFIVRSKWRNLRLAPTRDRSEP